MRLVIELIIPEASDQETWAEVTADRAELFAEVRAVLFNGPHELLNGQTFNVVQAHDVTDRYRP